jgi:hypothetical protein
MLSRALGLGKAGPKTAAAAIRKPWFLRLGAWTEEECVGTSQGGVGSFVVVVAGRFCSVEGHKSTVTLPAESGIIGSSILTDCMKISC